MTTTPARHQPAVLDADGVQGLAWRLEHGFTAQAGAAVPHLAHQYLLDALDRNDLERFLIWPAHDPLATVYTGPTGTVVPAGHPSGTAELAPYVDRVNWRVMIGDSGIAEPLLRSLPRTLLRRRPTARQQRFMVADPRSVPTDVRPAGFRPARTSDVERMTEFACRLHVEDRMGPPIGRSGRPAVRARVVDSIGREGSWVVERGGRAIAKFDLSLHSTRRGAQIAGVYVDREWRGHGIATEAVAALTALLLADGLPGVTLHVRTDNAAAIVAYHRAGFRDHGAWTLALR
jgi:uncharacterized protein